MRDTSLLDPEVANEMLKDVEELIKMLVSSIKTSKLKLK
jgi:hypothetical protein